MNDLYHSLGLTPDDAVTTWAKAIEMFSYDPGMRDDMQFVEEAFKQERNNSSFTALRSVKLH